MVAPGDHLGTVQRTLIVPVPPDVLWDMLALPEQLSRWFGEEVEQLDLRPDELITFRA